MSEQQKKKTDHRNPFWLNTELYAVWKALEDVRECGDENEKLLMSHINDTKVIHT